MTTNLARLSLAIGLLLGLCACARSHAEFGGDSSTHWLRRCDRDAQCGGLSCVCGVCSEGCKDDGQCARLGAKALCLTSASEACGQTEFVCDAQCKNDADCGASGWSCETGRCRRSVPGPREVSGTDLASTIPDSAALESGAPEAAAVEADAGTSVVNDGHVNGATSAPVTMGCAPQRARSDALDCLMTLGYAWNGDRCSPIVCGCVGDDCAALYPTQAACDAAHGECLSPATTCSGLPWYQCADHCPGDWNLAGGGRSFGECAGDCSFDLTLFPPSAPVGGSCLGSIRGLLTVKSSEGKPDRYVEFTLAPEAFATAMRLSRAILDLPLDPVMGCPDCVDQGRAWIKRSAAGSSAEFAYEFGTFRVPPALVGVDGFVQQMIDQANVCRGHLLESCTTMTAPAGNLILEPVCGVAAPVSTPPCTCSVPFEQLNTLNGTPCQGTCRSCNVASSTCGASCVQPCEGGDLRWKVFCTE